MPIRACNPTTVKLHPVIAVLPLIQWHCITLDYFTLWKSTNKNQSWWHNDSRTKLEVRADCQGPASGVGWTDTIELDFQRMNKKWLDDRFQSKLILLHVNCIPHTAKNWILMNPSLLKSSTCFSYDLGGFRMVEYSHHFFTCTWGLMFRGCLSTKNVPLRYCTMWDFGGFRKVPSTKCPGC